MRLLIIEDEETLCRSIAEGLRLDGYEVDAASDGDTGLDLALGDTYDLILLDLNLPDMDGMDVLREFRQINDSTPVLILSARIQLHDKLTGFDEGANDYLTKPFHFEELEARIRSLTHRRFVQEKNLLSFSGIVFDDKTRKTTVNGQEVHLTRKEAGILEYLLLHRGMYISQGTLQEHVWDQRADEISNAVRVHVSSLRRKLKAVLGFDPIQNKIGVGYILGGPEI